MKKSSVLVLYTGGTIGMAPKFSDKPSSLVPQSLNELVKYVPALNNLEFRKKVDIEFQTAFKPPLDSSSMKPKHWLKIAKLIMDVYDNYDGFVVLQGTDTMAFTATGLSFIFQNLTKPIVVTGSQLPISAIRTDAVGNFTNSLYIAAHQAFDLPIIPEVVICFASKILRGNRTTKISSKDLEGFDSPNYPALGDLGEHIEVHTELLRDMPKGKATTIIDDLDESVMNISIFPGLKPKLLEKIVNDDDVSGFVIQTFGAGNAPDDKEFLEVFKHARDKGKVVVNVTQCTKGLVEMGLYEASSGLLERGVISGLNMTSEAAIVKLMWALQTQFEEEVFKQTQINQRGEQSQNLFDLRFGEIRYEDKVSAKTIAKTPDGRFHINELSKAVIRLSNLRIDEATESDPKKLYVFLNQPKATNGYKETDSRCVHVFEVFSQKESNQDCDITEIIRDIYKDGPIYISLVSEKENICFCHHGLYLALFTKVAPNE